MNNEKRFVEDPRFQICFREMVYCYLFFTAFFVLVMLTMYKLGDQLVLGLPLWFLVSGVLIPVIFVLIVFILMEKVFDDTPLDPYIE